MPASPNSLAMMRQKNSRGKSLFPRSFVAAFVSRRRKAAWRRCVPQWGACSSTNVAAAGRNQAKVALRPLDVWASRFVMLVGMRVHVACRDRRSLYSNHGVGRERRRSLVATAHGGAGLWPPSQRRGNPHVAGRRRRVARGRDTRRVLFQRRRVARIQFAAPFAAFAWRGRRARSHDSLERRCHDDRLRVGPRDVAPRDAGVSQSAKHAVSRWLAPHLRHAQRTGGSARNRRSHVGRAGGLRSDRARVSRP